MPAGRPTKYLPEYCERVIELGREGDSVVAMAAKIGVARSTLENEWPAENPEFSGALAYARELSQQWWEQIGKDHLTAQTFQASMWSRSMAARFPNDWREQKEVTHKGNVTIAATPQDVDL